MSQARFQKRQREMARAEKLKAKVARKAERIEAAAEAGDPPPSQHDPGTVMAELELLHKKFADEQINFEEFEEQKAELLSRLVVE
jgi:hypothetical protein